MGSAFLSARVVGACSGTISSVATYGPVFPIAYSVTPNSQNAKGVNHIGQQGNEIPGEGRIVTDISTVTILRTSAP
jgi:collagenase-like PrtC family protease